MNGVDQIPDGNTTSRQILNASAERLDVTLTKEQFGDGACLLLFLLVTIVQWQQGDQQ